MKTKKLVTFIGILMLNLYLVSCGPSQVEVDAEATQVAANLMATQTAENPPPTQLPTPVPPTPTDTPEPATNTPTPTDTPVPPTNTPTSTSTPTPTDTLVPPTNTSTPVDTSTPTNTPVPPTDTPMPVLPTATAAPTTPPPPPTATLAVVDTAASPLAITWSEQMNYEGNAGESRWCQINMTYTNDTGEVYPWPDFRPVFFVVHADGSEAYVALGNYYSKADGWPNGIVGVPPNIPAGASADWTWYTSTQAAGQFCSIVGVTFQDWLYLAGYDSEGHLVETKIVPPQ